MQCVEFESRLNDLLDERLSPSMDSGLVEHVQSCACCSELLAAHELLLEGVQALPAARLSDAERQAFSHRVVAEVGRSPVEPFRTTAEVELAGWRQAKVERSIAAPMAIGGLVLAAAAALLIAVLPRLSEEPQLATPTGKQPSLGGTKVGTLPGSPNPDRVLNDYEDLAPIAWVGYQVADGLTPVTNSMVSALRELRKRSFFRTSDEPPRSSFYSPRQADEVLA
jgi:hypothetical protein